VRIEVSNGQETMALSFDGCESHLSLAQAFTPGDGVAARILSPFRGFEHGKPLKGLKK
jgi:hypothetical protein